VAPIAFVKISSDSAGITDFRLTPNSVSVPLIDGNDNFL